MGKPLTVFAWTLSGNYPGGSNPWNGQPLALQPAGTWYTPNTKPAAEEVNWIYGTIAEDLQAATAWNGNGPALNWQKQGSNISGSGTHQFNFLTFGCAAWDPLLSRWLVGYFAAANTGAFAWTYGADPLGDPGVYTLPGIITEFAAGGIGDGSGGNLSQIACCADPTTAGTFWVAVCDSGSGGSVVVYSSTGASWPAGITLGLFGTGSCALHAFASKVFCAVGSSSATQAYLAQVGPTHTTALTGMTGQSFRMVDNGSMMLVVPTFTVESTAGSYWTTTDGITFTSRSLSFLSSTDQVFGVDWGADALGPCWIMGVIHGSSVSFWRSGDGISWTQQAALTTTMVGNDLRMLGALAVVILGDASSTGPSGQIWSPDGGVTWYFGQPTFVSNTSQSNAYYTRQQLHRSNQGFLALNGNWTRFSLLGGVPAAALT